MRSRIALSPKGGQHFLTGALASVAGKSPFAVTSARSVAMSNTGKTIISNKQAGFNFHLEDEYTAGLMLAGWEVKALLAKKASLDGAFIHIKNGEIFLVNAHMTPAVNVAQHVHADPIRTRKLLLNRREIDTLIGQVEVKGYTLVPLRIFFGDRRIKLQLALAKGKKLHDKRDAEKEKDWKREQGQLLKQGTR